MRELMIDPRLDKLADVLIRHSTRLRAGEKVLIEAVDIPSELVTLLVRKAADLGAIPLVTVKQNAILRALYAHAGEAGLRLAGEVERYRMERIDAYIGVRGSLNVSELSDVPGDRMKLYQAHWWKPVHIDVRVRKTKWVVLRYPSASMAQLANLSTEAFEDFYFAACALDYGRMARAMEPLAARMARADRVRILGSDTDLRFSIRGIPAVRCCGARNIPDGEIFTAPVRDSVEGHVHFNARTIYQGTPFNDVRLAFQRGRIVRATADRTERLNEILDADEGARYCGEWALGFHPHIRQPMLDILFDEKIAGSFHLTPGGAYDEADNGNRSAVHWDLVMIQRPDYGGGEIWFDDELIRKDGLFVPADLQGLNPENLI
jgi:aminopeptidase